MEKNADNNVVYLDGNRKNPVSSYLSTNNTIYKNNIKALERFYPHIADKVKKTAAVKKYAVFKNDNNSFYNLYSVEKDFLYYNGKNPMDDSARQLEELDLKNAQMVLFLGFGLGYEVITFLQKEAPRRGTSLVVIIEKDIEIFKCAVEFINIVPLLQNQNIKFLVGVESENLFPELTGIYQSDFNIRFVKATKPVYHTSSFILHKEYYLNALKTWREACVFSLKFYGNSPDDSLIGVENMLQNITEIVSNPGINLLYNKFKGKPAVVVATGPSLNKNKHLLKGIEENALIISVDASLRILLDMGVKPNLVVSLERVSGVVKLMEGFKSEDVHDVYFAACPVILNDAYKVYPGPRIIVYRKFDHFTWLDMDKGMLDIKHSAGNMAFKVAEALGCDPIILIGQDLAFSREGATHAEGDVRGTRKQNWLDMERIEVPGNDGLPVYTNKVLYSFLKSYEIDVSKYSGTCINCTEGGAFINGTDVMPFKQAIEKYMERKIYPDKVIKESLSTFSRSDAEKDLKKVIDKIDEAIGDINKIVDYCHKGIDIINQSRDELESFLGNDKPGDSMKNRVLQVHQKVTALKTEMRNFSSTFQLLLMHILQSPYIKFEIDMHELPSKYEIYEHAAADAVLQHHKLFGIINNITLIVLERLEKAKKNLIDMKIH